MLKFLSFLTVSVSLFVVTALAEPVVLESATGAPFSLHFAFENNLAAGLPAKSVGEVQFTKGVVGRALLVHGNDYVEIADCQPLRSPIFTISAWIAPHSATSNGRVAEKGWSNSYWLRLNANKVVFGVWTGRYDEVASGTVLKSDEWAFVTGVCDGNSVKVYVNGELEAVQRLSLPPKFNSDPLVIGAKRKGVPDDNFVGSIDEFRYTNRALDDHEIEVLFRERSRSER